MPSRAVSTSPPRPRGAHPLLSCMQKGGGELPYELTAIGIRALMDPSLYACSATAVRFLFPVFPPSPDASSHPTPRVGQCVLEPLMNSKHALPEHLCLHPIPMVTSSALSGCAMNGHTSALSALRPNYEAKSPRNAFESGRTESS